jgi:predicted metal-dependent HD superfamily phosphohydrolase
MVSPERLDIMQMTWVRLLSRFNVEPAPAYPIFDRLIEAYQETHRHYHNLEHINEVLKVAGKLADQSESLLTIQLAIWFHDAVYDATRTDNERRSAELARELLLPVNVDPAIVETVERLILATAIDAITPEHADGKIMLDADRSILGADPKRYQRYVDGIRKEYQHVSDELWRAGRGKLLQHWLDQPRLFLTERMHSVGDEPARTNLRAELDALNLTSS